MIRTLYTVKCDEGLCCPSVHRVDGRPGLYVIGTRVTDAGLIADFADLTAPDEVLSWVPDSVIPGMPR